MLNFTLHNPVRLIFGAGQIASLAREVPGGARILLTYGGGSIKENGVYDQVRKALSGNHVVEFSGIEPNPAFETLLKALEIVKQEKIDFLLAVGGGSVLDGTKFIAAAACFDGDPWQILAKRPPLKDALPIGCVLTLPATGSEMNCAAVVSRVSTQEKRVFSSPVVFPRFSILDPETTYSLPARQISNGIVDAFVHVMEQYCTVPSHAYVQDRFAEGVLRTLIEVGPRSLENPMDYDARANLMWCATVALNGSIGSGVTQDWATHAIGHEITALHGLDHAQTLAIILPNLLWVQRETKREKLLQYADRVWDLKSGTEASRIEQAIVRTREFFESVGNPTHLSDYQVGDENFEAIVSRLDAIKRLPLGEKRDIDGDRVREILALSR